MESSDPWDRVELTPEEMISTHKNNTNKTEDPWDRLEEKDSWAKSMFRTLLQVPKGIAQGVAYPLDIINMIAQGSAMDLGDIEDLRRVYEREGVPFDEERYMQGVQQAAEMFPTISNISRKVEQETGLPLEAKTGLQKFVGFASTAGKLAPKGYTLQGSNVSLPRPVLGTGVAAVNETLKEHLPEVISEPLSFLALKKPTAGAGKFSIGKATKPSGMTTRRYEKLTEPKEVSAGKVEQINQKVESEFREISDKIIEKSPIKDIRTALKEGPAFKEEAAEAFEKVNELAIDMPNVISTNEVKKALADRSAKKSEGITKSEYEKEYNKFVNKYLKEMQGKDTGAYPLVRQYRKNNSELSEFYEPGQSKGYNRAKKEALLDYNKAIADTFENQFPNTEFSKLFSETNDKWSKIMDAEAIDVFIEDMFKGKIDFAHGKDFFSKNNMSKPFERGLGKEGFKDFKQLMTDLMSTEKANKMLKVAKDKGFKDLAETAGAYLIHPNFGYAKTLYKVGKAGYKKIIQSLLDKPQLIKTWDGGVKAFKKGDFKKAETIFKDLEAEVEILSKEATDAPKNAPKERIEPEILSKEGNFTKEAQDHLEALIEVGEIKNADDIIKAFEKYQLPMVQEMEKNAGKPFKQIVDEYLEQFKPKGRSEEVNITPIKEESKPTERKKITHVDEELKLLSDQKESQRSITNQTKETEKWQDRTPKQKSEDYKEFLSDKSVDWKKSKLKELIKYEKELRKDPKPGESQEKIDSLRKEMQRAIQDLKDLLKVKK